MTRVALVTGGAGGLGHAIAERLAADGNDVIIADINAAAGRAHSFVVDVADEDAVAALYAEIERRFGRLDILVNNAGIMNVDGLVPDPIEATPLTLWECTLRVNFSGAFLMCRGAVPLMQRGRFGRIVNISSRVARTRSFVRNPAYAASKSALIGLSRVLAGEVGRDGITVNCVAPSTVETAMTRAGAGEQRDYFAQRAAETALGRIGLPAEVGDAVAFLCSEGAGFITGAVLDVNGGSFMP